jgi:hypothetical protein
MTALSDHDRAQLRILVGRIIPASAEFDIPGADDAAILDDIVSTLASNGEQMTGVLATLESLAGAAAAGVDVKIQDLLRTDASAMGQLISVVAQCYYRDDRVMRSLGMEPRPPFPKGFVIEQGDWSLLDPVRARPKMWRDA